MNGKNGKKMIALLSGAAALCLGGALVCGVAPAREALAAAPSVEAFIDVGANADAIALDGALGLAAKGAQVTREGEVTLGSTLFASYGTGAAYTFTVSAAGEYQIAVALKAEEGKTLTVAGKSVSLAGKSGNCVVSVSENLADTTVAVEYDGALCGVLITAKDSKVLMTADYSLGQVVSYGALLEEELENATAHYSDGTTQELPISYDPINAGTGVNVNFTTIDVTGTVEAEGVTIPVKRYLTTMPEGLVYFINCGSYDVADPLFSEPETVDGYYSYNQTIFDYYGESLINYGTPDRKTTKGGDWGIYTAAAHNAPGDATFPYNSFVWTGSSVGAYDMGYMLSGLNASESYRVWFGTLSHWHGRTVNITFNDKVVGSDTMLIGSSKGFTVFENVKPDGNGKVDIHMTQVGSENEPTICFIAVQPMSVELPAAPAAPQGPSIVGMEDTSITLTSVAAGAKIQLYNAEKPLQLLYEEMVDGEKIGEDGSYELAWEKELGVSQFRIVQINAGGTSAPLLVSVTDIKEFKAYLASENYTTGAVTVCVEALADSGIASWSYRLGEYGETHEIVLDRPYKLNGTFEATENGVYFIVVTSGLGVTYSDTVTVGTIDPSAPVLNITPSKDGWKKGEYHLSLEVVSVAPVTEYKLYKDGKQIASETAAPETLLFGETGEYTVFVKTAAGQSTTSSFRVSEKPVTLVVRKSFERRQLRYSFGDSADYIVYSVTAYQLLERGVSKMTIADGNAMDVYDPGTYVVSVLTKDGSVEIFALDVTQADFSADHTGVVSFGGNGNGAGLAIGIGVGVGGIVLAAAAVVVTLIVTRKKES